MRHALDLIAGRAIGKGSDDPDGRGLDSAGGRRWLVKPRLTQPEPGIVQTSTEADGCLTRRRKNCPGRA